LWRVGASWGSVRGAAPPPAASRESLGNPKALDTFVALAAERG
jgi:hypothetical protein